MRLRAIRSAPVLAVAAGVGAWLAGFSARSEVASARRPLALFTPGPTLEYSWDGRWRFGGELALAQYVGGLGYGAAFGGSTSGRLYLEAQPALVLGGRHNLIVGLNPGLVVDVTAEKPRWGAQASLWVNYAHPRRHRTPLASPIVPFVRAQAIDSFGATITFGMMLKLPLPAS